MTSERNKSQPQTLTLDHVSPATRLLEKRRQMFEVQEALDIQKEEFARREEAFRRREESLRTKDLELQESLIKFNKFLQENESKRNRAEKRAQEEAKQRQIKEREIAELKRKLGDDSGKRGKLEAAVEKNSKYEKYLERVREANPDEYAEIPDLLNRYRTLEDANADLKRRQTEHELANEEKRSEFSEFKKVGSNNILNFNNMIARQQKELELAESDASAAALEVDISISKASNQSLEVGQVLMAVDNLLQRCTSKMHGENLMHTELMHAGEGDRNNQHSTDTELQKKGRKARMDLDIIAAYMVDFNKIVFEAPKSVRHGGDFAAPGAPGRKAAAAAEKKPQQQPEAQPPAGK